ncbi:MAG: protein kinase [Proteobacteria bacterium]|nr:protein kinase [Pseudomonadota bacterium]
MLIRSVFCGRSGLMERHDGSGASGSVPEQSQASALTARSDPLIGRVLDSRYRMEAVIGEGGMGLVYKAVHTALNKPLAIKVLRAEVSKNAHVLARFRQEAQSASAIGNQHIVDISDFGALPDGSTYIVMEYLPGRSLADAMSEGRLATQRIVRIARQLCHALGAAHEAGIVHRDLKPDNIQLIRRGGHDDFVKVLDFGIAKVGGGSSKLTQAGQVFGTPHYMSPEQCAGTSVDQRTDIYALGVILYELSSGRVPFDADSLMGILTKHIYENPIAPRKLQPPAGVPPGLEAVIMKSLSKKPEHRYQSMAEVAAELEAFEAGRAPRAAGGQRPNGAGGAGALGNEAGSRLSFDLGEPELPVKKPTVPILIGLGALAAIGGGLMFALGSSGEPALPQTDSPAPQQTAAPAPIRDTAVATKHETGSKSEGNKALGRGAEPASPQPPLAEQTGVRVESTPRGASVYRGTQLVGVTPLRIARPSGDEVIELELRKSGYRAKDIRVSASTAQQLRVELDKRSRPSKPRLDRTRATSRAPSRRKKPAGETKGQEREGPGLIPQSEVLDPWQ